MINRYNLKIALIDLINSFKSYSLWSVLGWFDVLRRYRRSVLGPFWITISMGVTVGAMGPLYGSLFGFDVAEFIPHLTLGLIFWGLFSAIINESVNAFGESAHYMKQSFIPAPVFVLRVLYRQIVIFLHNIILYPIILVILWKPININILWFLPAFILVIINLFFIALLISIFCVRFRDMAQVTTSITTLLFFVTPIIWKIDQLPKERASFVDWNILAIYLELLRKPILGVEPSMYEWGVVSFLAILFGCIAVSVFAKNKAKINYWL